MATIKAYVPVNFGNMNLNFYYAYFYDYAFQNNANIAFEGKTYSDVYTVNGFDGSNDLYLIAAGPSLSVSSTGIPQSGTVTAMGEQDAGSGLLWTATGINVSLHDLYLASSTTSNSDEIRLLRNALNGSDSITLSFGNDVFHGFNGNDKMAGKGGNDTLYGDDGNDVLIGGSGSDRLNGGSGSDRFAYNGRTEGNDIVVGFESSDYFQFSGSAFSLSVGQLAATRFRFRADNMAQDSNDRFIFRTGDDTLWFDNDGSGSQTPIKIADLSNDFALRASDILIV